MTKETITQVRMEKVIDVGKPPRGKNSKLELATAREAMSLLGIGDLSIGLYGIIDAYNSAITDLSPLNPSLSYRAEELGDRRQRVTNAYRLLANRYKSLPALVRNETEADLAAPSTSTALTTTTPGVYSLYDVSKMFFNRIHERINSITPEEIGVSRKKLVNHLTPEFNDIGRNPPIEKLREIRKRGFEGQFLPGAEYLGVLEFEDDGITHLKLRKGFDNIFYLSKKCRIKVRPSERRPSGVVERLVGPGNIFGSLAGEEFEFDDVYYLIGKMKEGHASKTEGELKKSMNRPIYKDIFGANPPTTKELFNFLRKIHGISHRGDLELVSVSSEELKHPLCPEVFEIFCAAEDSDLFKKKRNSLEFLELREKTEKPITIDPILNGKILGGLNFPICWWV